ncbi:LOW QUALITY PROTEIN: hypothetical protein Fmac_028648 [Flemingia macrophylla]|uniref:Uncharacterized protein n=1 Tax=Flemingia macrophylla TaxID=520843 RepID=A0ABD1L835_9FABA
MNLVTQLAANQKLTLFEESTEFVLLTTTILVSILLRSNLEWMSILWLMLQTPTADHHSSRDKAVDREDGSKLLFSARNDAIVIRGVHDVATDATAKTRKLDGKLGAIVNLVTQLAANQKPATVARGCGSVLPLTTILLSVLLRSNLEWMTILSLMLQTPIAERHRSIDKALDREDGSQLLDQFSARNDAIVIRGVHDVDTDTSAETRKLEGTLGALVNLVTLLAANQKPAFVAIVCGIRSSNDHHTSVCPSSQQSGVDEHPEAYAANTYSKPPQLQRQGNTSAETGKQESKLDALVILVTQLAANQKPASVARVCGIRSSNDHHSSVCPFFAQELGWMTIPRLIFQFIARNDAIVIRGVHDVATDTSAESGKPEGKLDALVNLVTQLAANQKPASIASQFSARDDTIVIRGVHDVAIDTSAEIGKLEGKSDALMNLVTQLPANQKPASIASVCGIRSSNDHHICICPSSQQSGWMRILRLMLQTPIADHHSSRDQAFYREDGSQLLAQSTTAAEARQLIGKIAPNSSQFSARNDAIIIRGVHDLSTDTSDETTKLEGKLDALVHLVTHLAAD